MNIITLPLGAYQTNCYLVWAEGSNTCAVIDPGYEAQRILLEAKKWGKTVETILLTHGHFDHVGAVRELVEATGCRVYLCLREQELPLQYTAGELYYTESYGETVTAGGATFEVLQTPGHTPGSVCLKCGNVLFSGDTLFAGSCGRTDLPGGSWMELSQSLKALAFLDGDYAVYPGHGPATTLSREREKNPYLKGAV